MKASGSGGESNQRNRENSAISVMAAARKMKAEAYAAISEKQSGVIMAAYRQLMAALSTKQIGEENRKKSGNEESVAWRRTSSGISEKQSRRNTSGDGGGVAPRKRSGYENTTSVAAASAIKAGMAYT